MSRQSGTHNEPREAICPDCDKPFLTRSYRPVVRCRECRKRRKYAQQAQFRRKARAMAKADPVQPKPVYEVLSQDDPWKSGRLPSSVRQNALWG